MNEAVFFAKFPLIPFGKHMKCSNQHFSCFMSKMNVIIVDVVLMLS